MTVCPHCARDDSLVRETRVREAGVRYRRRMCRACGGLFSTEERLAGVFSVTESLDRLAAEIEHAASLIDRAREIEIPLRGQHLLSPENLARKRGGYLIPDDLVPQTRKLRRAGMSWDEIARDLKLEKFEENSDA